MFRWFRRAPALPDAALAMVGPRPSDEVLFLGAKDPSLAAETGAITRLNGRTVVVGQGADAGKRIDQAATQAGAILEFVDAPFTPLPFDAATFHIVVAPIAAEWWTEYASSLAEAARVLRPGGRIVVIIGERSRGPFRVSPARPPALATDAVLALLKSSGFIAARQLAETDGVTYYEATKSRESR